MNEYQSSILIPNSVFVYYQQFKSGDRFFPIAGFGLRVPENPSVFQLPNGYFGLIEFSDDEDISEYTEVYDKYYGTPIDLDPSYLDMVSSPKKLKVSFNWGGTLDRKFRISGSSTEEAVVTQNISANIEGDFDVYEALALRSDSSDYEWSSTLKRDRSSRASQLNHNFIYGAYKKGDGTFWEGETPHEVEDDFSNFPNYPPIESPSRIAKLLPEIYFEIDNPAMDSNGNSYNVDSSLSHTSQDGGSASASFSSSVSASPPPTPLTHGISYNGYDCKIIIRVIAIVITPTKIKAWVDIGGSMRSPVIIFSTSSDPKSIESIDLGRGPYEKVGDISFNFLGANITAFIYKSNYFLYQSIKVPSASFTGSFSITKEEDY